MAKSPGSDVVSHFAYDARWRIVARYEDANSDPTEQFVFHHAGLASTGSGSYIDAVMLRDRDTTDNGTLDERVYHLHNWRSDVVALISHAGSQIEQVRYEPYGTPFGMPAGDIDADGKVTQDDLDQAAAWYSGTAYDVRGDLDMNGVVNLSDLTYIAGNKALNHETGRGVLSLEHIASRKGYASYEHLAELEGSGVKWDVRNRVLLSDIGTWNRRDPLAYIDGMNLYEYVSLMPLIAQDPMGLAAVYIDGGGAPATPVGSSPCDVGGGNMLAATSSSMCVGSGSGGKPLTDAECCKRVRRQVGGGTQGTIACCEGKAVICVFVDYECQRPNMCQQKGCEIAQTVMNDCTRQHEEVHLPDIMPCDPNARPRLSLFKPGIGDDSECRAYRVSLNCLMSQLANCHQLLDGTGLDPNDPSIRNNLPARLTAEQRCAVANWWKCKRTLEREIETQKGQVDRYCRPKE